MHGRLQGVLNSRCYTVIICAWWKGNQIPSLLLSNQFSQSLVSLDPLLYLLLFFHVLNWWIDGWIATQPNSSSTSHQSVPSYVQYALCRRGGSKIAKIIKTIQTRQRFIFPLNLVSVECIEKWLQLGKERNKKWANERRFPSSSSTTRRTWPSFSLRPHDSLLLLFFYLLLICLNARGGEGGEGGGKRVEEVDFWQHAQQDMLQHLFNWRAGQCDAVMGSTNMSCWMADQDEDGGEQVETEITDSLKRKKERKEERKKKVCEKDKRSWGERTGRTAPSHCRPID